MNGALAAAPAGLSARLVAGARRGAPKARHAGGPRASPRVPSRRSAADALAASLGRRSPAPRLAAVREPAGDARRADVASTSFGAEDARRDEPGGASADAARRVRAAKSAASRYGAGSDAEADAARHGLASPDDENPGSAAHGSGGTDASSRAVEKGGGGAGASRAPGGRGAGGSRPATNASTSSPAKAQKPKKIDYRLRTRARTKYNRPSPNRRDDASGGLGGGDEDASSSSKSGVEKTADADDPSSERNAPRRKENVWLSNRHTRRPGQQPQQRRRSVGNSPGVPQKGGMRPGERIVAALQKVPGELLDAESERLEKVTEKRVNGFDDFKTSRKKTTSVPDDDVIVDDASGYAAVDSAVTRPLGSRANFSAPTLNFAIKELGERGDFNRAHALFLWMRAQKTSRDDVNRDRGSYRPNRHTLASLFGAASDRAHAKTVIKTWRDAVRADKDEFCNSEVASAAIAALARCENWPAALQVWQDLGDRGEPRNVYCYTAVLSCLKDARRWEEAGDVFRAMRDEPGCAPDATCAGLTLATFDAARKWREGNALAKRFGDVYDVPSEERLTHAIISLAGRAGDMNHARAVLNRALNDRAHVVTTYTYNCLLGGYARCADWDGARDTFAELKRARFVPDAYTYTHLISAAERAGKHHEADAVWQEALSSSSRGRASSVVKTFKPHTVMCGAYVHCLGTQGRWMEAEAVVAKMRDEWGVARNAAVYNALLGALVRGNNVDKALRVFDSMQSDERPAVIPTEISFMILIRACVDDGLTGKAKELSAIRDALAESGALENDFSKYESRDVEARASAFRYGGSSSGYGGSSYASDADAGRLSAGLPPIRDASARRGTAARD